MKGIYERIVEMMGDEHISIKGKRLFHCFSEFIEEISEHDPMVARKFHDKMEEIIAGPHFTEHTLDKALSGMVRKDGSKGKYWSLEQTNDVAFQGKLKFTEEFNQYDFCYAMNYSRSIYSEALKNILGDESIKAYFELAKAWKPDGKTVPEGAIWKMYKAANKEDHYHHKDSL